MTFELPEDAADIVEALRAAESQAPKQLKPLLLQAANELHALKRAVLNAVDILDNTAQLRAGMMDSESRAADINNQIRNNVTGAVTLLRAALGK